MVGSADIRITVRGDGKVTIDPGLLTYMISLN